MDKPNITIPEGDAPTDLVLEDITVGDGSSSPATCPTGPASTH